MFGVKFNKQRLNSILSNVKSHLNNGYHNTKSFLNHVDTGVRTAKQLYTIVEPIIEAYAGHHHRNIHKTVMNGLSGYEKIKKQIVDGHDEAIHHVNSAGKKLVNLGIN